MLHFLQNCIRPDAVTMLAIAVFFLFYLAYTGYKGGGSLIWILYLFVGVIAAIAWLFLVAA